MFNMALTGNKKGEAVNHIIITELPITCTFGDPNRKDPWGPSCRDLGGKRKEGSLALEALRAHPPSELHDSSSEAPSQ